MTSWSIILLKIVIKKLFTFPYLRSDTIPAWNYGKISETNNSRYVSRFWKFFNYNFDKEFAKINNQLIDKYGFSEEFIYYINKEKSYHAMLCEYKGTNNKSLITKLKLKKRELENIKPKSDSNILDIQPTLERWLHFPLNIKKISIDAFYSYAEQYKKYLKSQADG